MITTNMSHTYAVLVVLSSNPALTVHQIMSKLEEHELFITKAVVGVYASKLKERGYVSMEKLPCSCCGTPTAHYGITEYGRTAINYYTKSLRA